MTVDDKVGDLTDNYTVFIDDEDEVESRRAIFPNCNPNLNYKPPTSYDPSVPFSECLMQKEADEKPSNGDGKILIEETIPQETAIRMVNVEDATKINLNQLSQSIRYASMNNGYFFPVLISSSFTGLDDGALMEFQNHTWKPEIFTWMKPPNIKQNNFKMDGVEEATLIEGDELEEENSVGYENQWRAPIFYEPLPIFKEPEHRKAKFKCKDGWA